MVFKPLPLVLLLLLGLAGALWLLRAEPPGVPLPAEAPSARTPLERVERGVPALAGSAVPRRPILVEGWSPSVTTATTAPGCVLSGHVIDMEGRAAPDGTLSVWTSGAPPGTLLEAPVMDGLFEVAFEAAHAGRVILAYRSGDAWASADVHATVAAAQRVDGLEVLAVPLGTLRVEVLDETGQPAPSAEVVIPAQAAHRELTVTLDASGCATLNLPPGTWNVQAQRPGGRFRAAGGVNLLAGGASVLQLRLAGPWGEVPVRVVSKPAGALTGTRATVWVHAPQGGVKAEADVDGPAVSVLLPPSGRDLSLGVGAGPLARGALNARWGEDDVARASREGLTVPVERLADLHLELRDAAGRPLPGFLLYAEPPGYRLVTDAQGRARVAAQPLGRVTLRSLLYPLGVVEVRADSDVQAVVVPQTARVGGRWSGPARVGGWTLDVAIDAGPGLTFLGWVDADAGRWWASLPLPEGREVGVRMKTISQACSDEVRGILGRDDLDLVCGVTELTVVPRLGRIVRPRGLLRVRGEPGTPSAAFGSSCSVDPQWQPTWTFGPLGPGRYHLAFSTDNGATWIEHAEPVELDRAPRTVGVTFERR